MDPDFRNLDVDQDLNLSIPYADSDQQSAHPTSTGRSHLLSVIQYYSDRPVDRSVPTGRQSLA